jgi:hypothetical protein
LNLAFGKSYKYLLAVIVIFLLCSQAAFAEERPHAVKTPEGYVIQKLRPLGGELLMPQSWHFVGGITEIGFLYTASKELRADGSYDTGFRIQGIMKIKERYHIAPLDAVVQNIEAKKKGAIEIIKECKETQEGLFKKRCLETVEKVSGREGAVSFHIVYSFFWNDTMDTMIANTFGTPVSEWNEEVKIYNVMKNLVLFDKTKAEGLSENLTKKIEMTFSQEKLNVHTWKEGKIETKWLSDNELQVKACVTHNTRGKLNQGDYKIKGDTIILEYYVKYPADYPEITESGLYTLTLIYTFKNIEKKNYRISIEEIPIKDK